MRVCVRKRRRRRRRRRRRKRFDKAAIDMALPLKGFASQSTATAQGGGGVVAMEPSGISRPLSHTASRKYRDQITIKSRGPQGIFFFFFHFFFFHFLIFFIFAWFWGMSSTDWRYFEGSPPLNHLDAFVRLGECSQKIKVNNTVFEFQGLCVCVCVCVFCFPLVFRLLIACFFILSFWIRIGPNSRTESLFCVSKEGNGLGRGLDARRWLHIKGTSTSRDRGRSVGHMAFRRLAFYTAVGW